MSDEKLVRNIFNENLITEMAVALKKATAIFNTERFITRAAAFNNDTPFKTRAQIITDALINELPNDFETAANTILDSFHHIQKAESWNAFYFMPFGEFVAQKGCHQQHLKTAFQLIYEITKRFTSEFAIRPFLEHFPEETMQTLKIWSTDENEHVRRLVSEGSRPRLPWAKVNRKLVDNPTPSLLLLEKLKTDSSKYVQKSVANHLNDITKDHSAIVFQTLNDWKKLNNKNTNWIIKHALRNELKKGTREAMKILGFKENPKIIVSDFKISHNHIDLGNDLFFDFNVLSQEQTSVALMIDYIIHYQKANGKTAPKTYKLKTTNLNSHQLISIKKKQAFKPISTRKLYSGTHRIELFINGQSFGSKPFTLKV